MRTGWIDAIGFVICVGALSLTYAIGHGMGVHPGAFILFATLSSGLCTLAVVGIDAKRAWQMVRSPLGWVIGCGSILVELFYYLMLSQGLPAHGNVLLRLSVPLSMAVGWLLLARRPACLAALGGTGILLAAGLAAASLPASERWPLVGITACGACTIVVRGFAMELHPCNRGATDLRDRLRLSACLLLTASVVAMLLLGGAAVLGHARLAFVPTVAQLLHGPTVLLGCTVGALLLTLMGYLNLAAALKIGTENIVAMMALTPITAGAFLEIGAQFGLVARPDTRYEGGMLAGALFALFVSVVCVLVAARRQRGS